MQYNIKAIPTDFGGVRFRSRLEARWAAFFDLCGWEWEYEPFDLEGWCPDFSIRKINGSRVLVEVKPFDFASMFFFTQRSAFVEKNAPKACRENYDLIAGCEAIVVGLTPFESEVNGAGCIGVFSAGDFGSVCMDDGLSSPKTPIPTTGLDFSSDVGCFDLRIRCVYEGDHFLSHMDLQQVEVLWKEAGNRVQWKPKSRRGRR